MREVMIIAFLILLAVIFISVSLGLRLLEAHRHKQVASLLTAVDGPGPEGQPKEALLLPSRRIALPADTAAARAWRGLDRYLQQAGMRWTVGGLILATVALAAAGAALGWIIRPLGFLWLSATVGAVVLAAMPIAYVKHRRTSRLAEIEGQLPEALDFLARSMRAGHAFSISLEMLSRELPAPLGQEFRALFNELNLGASTESALHNLSARVPVLDVRLFVSSVLLQKQTGGNLSEILVRLAYVIRERFRLRGQVRVASAHGRLTALVLTLLPVFLVGALLILAPDYLKNLAEDPDGKWMILGAICAQVLGYYIMHRIVTIRI